MKALMEQQVIPLLKSRFDTQLVWEEIVHVGGIPESELAMQLQSFEQNLPEEISIAYLPEPGMVKVKLSLSAAKNEEISARAMLLEQVNKLENILSNAIYAHNTESIESVVFDLLQQSGKTLAIAESCTGGSISSKLVQLPGISSILKGSVVSYSNEVKIEILKVKKSSIELEGSVSQQVAIEMADGVRKLCGADYGLSVTGIAGPDGGSPEKPVGTVWIGLSSEQGNEAFSFLFEANRARNIQRSVLMALILLRKKHLGILGDAAN
jgi:nicotinamide-nucleotide amidase